MSYYLSKYVDQPFAEAAESVRAAVKAQGFGIPAEMDFSAMMLEKLGASVRPYLILGTCMPKLALRAVELEEQLGTLLPCNWLVQEHEDGRVEVSVLDPLVIQEITENLALRPLLEDARARIIAALDEIN